MLVELRRGCIVVDGSGQHEGQDVERRKESWKVLLTCEQLRGEGRSGFRVSSGNAETDRKNKTYCSWSSHLVLICRERLLTPVPFLLQAAAWGPRSCCMPLHAVRPVMVGINTDTSLRCNLFPSERGWGCLLCDAARRTPVLRCQGARDSKMTSRWVRRGFTSDFEPSGIAAAAIS